MKRLLIKITPLEWSVWPWWTVHRLNERKDGEVRYWTLHFMCLKLVYGRE